MQTEMFPPKGMTQFWLNGSERWHAEHEGMPSVRRGRYVIELVSPAEASALLAQHHYLGGRLPGKFYCHGVRDTEDGALVGVATYGPGGAPAIRKAAFPSLFVGFKEIRKASCAVLDRFVLLDGVPANAETHILKLSFALALEMGVRGIVSFSDPVARTTLDGKVIFPGHIGQIYKGKGMIYTGRSSKEWCVIFKDGRIQPRRSLTAWANAEGGHDYVYAELVAYGAPPILADEPRAVWLERALPLVSRPFHHTGQHRYIARLDGCVELSGRLVVQPYPRLEAVA